MLQQLAYVVKDGQGALYRDGIPFSQQTSGGRAGRERLLRYCAEKAGGAESLRLAVGAYPRSSEVANLFTGSVVAVRFYARALSPDELLRNRAATLGH